MNTMIWEILCEIILTVSQYGNTYTYCFLHIRMRNNNEDATYVTRINYKLKNLKGE